MRHGVKKIKIQKGKDANKMLVKKLARNFFLRGKIETTFKKAKILKSVVDSLVSKSKTATQANKNYLLSRLGDKKVVDMLFQQIAPAVKNVIGGYVKIVKLGVRTTDGSAMARLVWAYPVVINRPKNPEHKKTEVIKPEKK